MEDLLVLLAWLGLECWEAFRVEVEDAGESAGEAA